MKHLKLRKIGNSVGLIVPKETLEELGLSEGDELTATTLDGKLILEASDAEHARVMRVAREGMKRYRDALAELAK